MDRCHLRGEVVPGNCEATGGNHELYRVDSERNGGVVHRVDSERNGGVSTTTTTSVADEQV